MYIWAVTVTDEHRCPRCGSYAVRKHETKFAAVTVVELACENCRHEEERRSDAADHAAWVERWRGRLRVPIYDYDDDLVDVD